MWAVPCKDLSSDWAVQRIRGLSLKIAIKNMFFKNRKTRPKTLAEEFLYPKNGPGEFYRLLENTIRLNGTNFLLNSKVVSIIHNDGQ